MTIPPDRLGEAEARWARRLALIYLGQAVIAIVLLAWLVPPFANSDEGNHMRRVDQIAHGGLVARRFQGPAYASGGRIDRGIAALDDASFALRVVPDPKALHVSAADLDRFRWGGRVDQSFPNTSIYPPVLYVPAVAGEWTGRAFGLSVATTAMVSRLFGGGLYALVIAGAIAASAGAAPWLALWASLPMSLSLLAAVTQDSGMLAAGACSVAFLARMARGNAIDPRMARDGMPDPRAARRLLWGLGVALALLATARPAYAPLAALPLVAPGYAMRARLAASAGVLLATLAWTTVDAVHVMTNWSVPYGGNPHAQFASLATHPWRIATLIAASMAGGQGVFGQSWWHETIGVLGSVDVVLPGWFYLVTLAAIGLCVALTLARVRPVLPPRAQAAVAAASLASAVLVFVLQDIVATPPWSTVVLNVQGRYFLPIWALLAIALPAVARPAVAPQGRLVPAFRDGLGQAARISLVAFMTLSVVVTVASVIRHYGFA